MGKHHMQIARATNIALVMKWIRDFRQEHGDKPIDQRQLLRKVQLVIGASKETAREYIDIVLGEQ